VIFFQRRVRQAFCNAGGSPAQHEWLLEGNICSDENWATTLLELTVFRKLRLA
jgi:hypothetical protein